MPSQVAMGLVSEFEIGPPCALSSAGPTDVVGRGRVTDQNAAAVGKAMSHPLRLSIVTELRKAEPLSPNGLSKALDASLGNVSYHVKTLLEAGRSSRLP